MVSRKERIIVWIMLLVLLTTPVHAGWFDGLWGKTVDPSGEWTDCLDVYSEEQCLNYCSGDDKDVRCTYPVDYKRTFSVQLFPTDCAVNSQVPSDLIGGISGNEFAFQYIINMNVDKDWSAIDRNGCGDFEEYHYTSNYNIAPRMLNNIKLHNQWYVDSNGLPFIEIPTQREMNAIYGKNNAPDIALFDKEYMLPSKYSILNIKYDCDYQGVYDDEYEGFVNVDNPQNQKSLEEWLDFTKSNVFNDDFDSQTYQDTYEDIFEEYCGTWDSFFSTTQNALVCFRLWDPAERFFNMLTGENASTFIEPGESKYRTEFLYSKRNSHMQQISCNYPDDEYASRDNVTIKVQSRIAHTQEHYLLSGEGVDDDWDNDLGLDCNDESGVCLQEATVTFSIEGTGDNRTLEFIDYSFEGINQTNKEAIDDTRSDFNRPPAPEVRRQALDGLEEQFVLDLEIAEDKAYRDRNQESAVSMVKEFALYLISFNMLIVYFMEISLFVGIFAMVMNSFKHAKNAFKKVFMIGGNK
jgi:hypothetical protein